MTRAQRLVPGAMLAAGLLALSPTLHAQYLIAAERSVYGRCAVEAKDWRDNFGTCRLTATEDGAVPAGWTMVIEHISASCRGPVEHPITLLALNTEIEPTEDMLTQIVIPLSRSDAPVDGKAQYQGSFVTRLYAGGGTKVETYLALAPDYPAGGGATCGVMFHGRLVPMPQWSSWAPWFGRSR